ncbi:MAG: hypothetical protein FWC13_05285 [Oscillospiraceae bacterium]|nr:hypothetical protein [Oscillospiraceae bacterium]
MKAVYREQRYICGDYLDVYIYPVYRKPSSPGAKAQPSTETQAKLNARNSTEQLTRLIHTNFTPRDLSIGLDYAINPPDDETAKKDIQNFIRRLKRKIKKLGLPELKYIVVTEKSTRGRYHHHIIINGNIDRDEVERLWGHGRANARRLQFNETGVADLAKYISKSPIFYKRWFASRNLERPYQPKPNDYRIKSRRRAAELASETENYRLWEKLYPDHSLGEVRPFHNEENGGVYLFARLYRKDSKFIEPLRKRRPERSRDMRDEQFQESGWWQA